LGKSRRRERGTTSPRIGDIGDTAVHGLEIGSPMVRETHPDRSALLHSTVRRSAQVCCQPTRGNAMTSQRPAARPQRPPGGARSGDGHLDNDEQTAQPPARRARPDRAGGSCPRAGVVRGRDRRRGGWSPFSSLAQGAGHPPSSSLARGAGTSASLCLHSHGDLVRSRQPRAHTRGDPGMERPHARREERPRAGDLRPATSADPGQHTKRTPMPPPTATAILRTKEHRGERHQRHGARSKLKSPFVSRFRCHATAAYGRRELANTRRTGNGHRRTLYRCDAPA
jgi:hypothetical protein